MSLIIKRKSQSWSLDVILGVVVFFVALFIFYGVINASAPSKKDRLREDASLLSKLLTTDGSDVGIIVKNELNESKFISLKNVSYAELKSRVKIESDFCVYLEDDEGKVVPVNFTYRGLGSGTINVTGIPCNTT